MPRIDELPAEQLARHAFNVFLFEGRHVTGARLIYRALILNPKEPLALRCLSDFLDNEGTEQLSAAVLEYALSPQCELGHESRRELDDLLFLAKWSWGFSRHESGQTALSGDAFLDRSRFHIDEQGYQAFLAGVVEPAGSLTPAFRAAHTLVGALGGCLESKKSGRRAELEEIFAPEDFIETAEYGEWLNSGTEELDALEAARNARSER